MLVATIQKDESIFIDDGITVTALDVHCNGRVTLGILTPDDISVRRTKLEYNSSKTLASFSIHSLTEKTTHLADKLLKAEEIASSAQLTIIKYAGNDTYRSKLQCKICDNEFSRSISDVKRGRTCPKCKKTRKYMSIYKETQCTTSNDYEKSTQTLVRDMKNILSHADETIEQYFIMIEDICNELQVLRKRVKELSDVQIMVEELQRTDSNS